MNDKLRIKISEILIFSRYAEVTSCKLIDPEIQQFKDSAFDLYLGRGKTKEDPHAPIFFNTFHAKVDIDLGLILNAIDEYNDTKENDLIKILKSANHEKDQLIGKMNCELVDMRCLLVRAYDNIRCSGETDLADFTLINDIETFFEEAK